MSQGNNYPKGPANRTLGMSEVTLVSRTTGNIVFSNNRNADVPNAVPVYVEGGNITVDVEVDVGVQIEGIYNAVTNPNPDNVGLIVHVNNAAPGDVQQTVRTTGGASNITIASNTFYGIDTRSKLYAGNGADEQALNADGYGRLYVTDPRATATEDEPVVTEGPQVMMEARSGQAAAIDNEDAGRPVMNLYKEQVVAGHTWATNSNRVEEINPLDQRYVGPETLVSTAVDFTAAFADLGVEIPCAGYKKIGVWLTLDVNDSENMRIKALAKHTSGGAEEYNLPIESAAPDKITVQDEYYEFVDDNDQLVLLTIEVDNIVPYLQLQIQAGVVGATAGQADAVYITKAW